VRGSYTPALARKRAQWDVLLRFLTPPHHTQPPAQVAGVVQSVSPQIAHGVVCIILLAAMTGAPLRLTLILLILHITTTKVGQFFLKNQTQIFPNIRIKQCFTVYFFVRLYTLRNIKNVKNMFRNLYGKC
jgi:hypothetical protein